MFTIVVFLVAVLIMVLFIGIIPSPIDEHFGRISKVSKGRAAVHMAGIILLPALLCAGVFHVFWGAQLHSQMLADSVAHQSAEKAQIAEDIRQGLRGPKGETLLPHPSVPGCQYISLEGTNVWVPFKPNTCP